MKYGIQEYISAMRQDSAGGTRIRISIDEATSGEEEYFIELAPGDAIEFAKELVREAMDTDDEVFFFTAHEEPSDL